MLKKGLCFPNQVLVRYVYDPWGRSATMSHDSYSCAKYAGLDGAGARPFPTRRVAGPGNFVGAPFVTIRDKIDVADPKNRCPERCRREPDWTYC